MRRILKYKRVPGRRLAPHAAQNAKARKVGIVTGVDSKALRGELDGRFAFAKQILAYEREYQAHLGSDRSVVENDLCRSAARHKAIANLAHTRLMKAGPFDDKDEIRVIYEAFRRADGDHRSVLATLGIQRREKPIPDLNEYLRSRRKRLPVTLDNEADDAD